MPIPSNVVVSPRHRQLLWLLLTAFVLISLYVLGLRTLVPPDEGRYAEMARGMFASGDWITTRLNLLCATDSPMRQPLPPTCLWAICWAIL